MYSTGHIHRSGFRDGASMLLRKAAGFCRAQPVLAAAFIAAVITVFVIPPDEKYADYCNFNVLAELFALMIAVGGLRTTGLFERLTGALLKRAGSARRLALIFVSVCFFSSMLITNDVALITFVPLTLLAFAGAADERSTIITTVLETAAANLGSMLTPIGNPQNLYIYDEYGMTALQFLQAMLPLGAVSFVCLVLLSRLIPAEKCTAPAGSGEKVRLKPAIVYGALFALCIAAVFRLLPFWLCMAASVVTALILDRRLLLKVDYALLFTFICFFVFVGNISRIEAVCDLFSGILSGNEIVVSALLSQVISNVPAAVMLSGFTGNGTALLVGVNVGGLGTPIASMASLISLQFYRKTENARTGRYLGWFSAVNFGMLLLLLALSLIIYR